MIVYGSVPGSAWFRLVLEGGNMDTLNMCFRVCIDVDMYMHGVFVLFHKKCIDIYVPGPHVFHVCSVMVIAITKLASDTLTKPRGSHPWRVELRNV